VVPFADTEDLPSGDQLAAVVEFVVEHVLNEKLKKKNK
jgi:hypothetical protein